MEDHPVSRSDRPARYRARLVLAMATAALAAAALAACGGGSTGSVGPATPVPSGVIAVEAKDYAFEPATLTVPAGTVTFSVKNVGSQEHEFEIFKGETVINEIEGLVPGLTKDLTLTLDAGEYTFICKLNGHDQLGMKGTLTVTGG
jgi:iron uptake system component EfeO